MADEKLGMLLTNAGAALLARVMNGEKLVFTRGAFGDSMRDGQMVTPDTAEQARLEQLINERLSLPLIKITPTGAYAELDMQVLSAQVDESFMVSEIGLFAKIGDEEEKLYGYFNAGLKGDYMPAKFSSIAKDYVYTVVIVIGNAQNVSAVIYRTDYELPIATESVLGGVKLSDEFYTTTDEKLRLSGKVRSDVNIYGGLDVRDSLNIRGGLNVYDSLNLESGATVSLTSNEVHISRGKFYFEDNKAHYIKGVRDSEVNISFPNTTIYLGTVGNADESLSAIPAVVKIHGQASIEANESKVSLESASVRAGNTTIYSGLNSEDVTFNAKTHFTKAVSPQSYIFIQFS